MGNMIKMRSNKSKSRTHIMLYNCVHFLSQVSSVNCIIGYLLSDFLEDILFVTIHRHSLSLRRLQYTNITFQQHRLFKNERQRILHAWMHKCDFSLFRIEANGACSLWPENVFSLSTAALRKVVKNTRLLNWVGNIKDTKSLLGRGVEAFGLQPSWAPVDDVRCIN